MRVIVDTSVWSLLLRRRPRDLTEQQVRWVAALRNLIVDGRAVLVGMVRQELLSGIKEDSVFEQLCDYLRFFDDEVPEVSDYEQAARFERLCRAAGVATSPVDMLLCAIASRRDLPLLTVDGDFRRYAEQLPVRLYSIR